MSDALINLPKQLRTTMKTKYKLKRIASSIIFCALATSASVCHAASDEGVYAAQSDNYTVNNATGGGWFHNNGTDDGPVPQARVTGDIVLSKQCDLSMTNSNATVTVGPYGRGNNTYISTVTMKSTCDGLNLVAWFTDHQGDFPVAVRKNSNGGDVGDYIRLTVDSKDFDHTTENNTGGSHIFQTAGAPGAGVPVSFNIRLKDDIGGKHTGVFTYTIEGRLAIA
ncbi:TPA: hypothetical protein ACXKGF_005225 [Escherichia coli]